VKYGDTDQLVMEQHRNQLKSLCSAKLNIMILYYECKMQGRRCKERCSSDLFEVI
jgi:hypothetical protein